MAFTSTTSIETVKPLAAFDLDGTTFKKSILEALVDVLIQNGFYSEETITELREREGMWQSNNSERLYLDYIQAMVESFLTQLAGHQVNELELAAQSLQLRRRRFATEAMRLLSQNYTTVAISGSPQLAVEVFTEQLGLCASYGSRVDIEKGIFLGTGRTIDKVKMIRELVEQGKVTLTGSVSFGDTFSDAPMLGLTQTAICINPSANLEVEARNRNWHVVRESKDNISHVSPDGRYHSVQSTLDILERIGLKV